MTRILLIDAGSSSVKFRIHDSAQVLLNGQVDRVGSHARMRVGDDEYSVRALTHAAAFERVHELVTAVLHGHEPDATVHRIVHGGSRTGPVRLTRTVVDELATFTDRAPLHQGAQLAIAQAAMRLYPRATHIGCFDTAFHARMPAVARTYAIPHAIAATHHIHRSGYHGLAHEAMLVETAELLGRRPSDLHVITLQLGNGVSACAIRDRQSIDTTMGFTPLEGLVMGTRSGSIDPALVPYLCERLHATPQEVLRLLEHESGLLGIAGTNDVRDLLAREHTDPRARLALDVFAYAIRKQIGAYIAILGRVDSIIMAGGISQSPVMRRRILSGLEHLGIAINPDAIDEKAPTELANGAVPVFAVLGDEMELMRQQAMRVLRAR